MAKNDVTAFLTLGSLLCWGLLTACPPICSRSTRLTVRPGGSRLLSSDPAPPAANSNDGVRPAV